MNAPVSNTLGAISTSDLQKWIGLSCFQMMIDLEFHADQHTFCKLGRIVVPKVVREVNTPTHFGNENCFSNLKAMGKEIKAIYKLPWKNNFQNWIWNRISTQIQNWIWKQNVTKKSRTEKKMGKKRKIS